MTEMERQPPRRPRPRKRRSLLLPLLLVGFALAGLFFIVFLAILAFTFGDSQPVRVASGSVLDMTVSGVIAEYQPPGPFDYFLDDKPLQLNQYLSALRKARDDSNIEGVRLRVEPTTLGWAQLQELRNAILDFRKSGKWVVSFGEIWQEREYYLASAADESHMIEDGLLFFDGFMSKSVFYAELMKKYGVGVQVQAFGEYKTYADTFRNAQMSEPHREATAALLAGFERAFCDAVAESRGMTPEAVREALVKAVYQSVEAKEMGLLDGNLYPDQINDKIAERLGLSKAADLRFVSAQRYAPSVQGSSFSGDAIAVIYASGAIQPGSAASGILGDRVIGADAFISDLKAARKNPSVKAIVVRIDSPGGAASSSDLIWRELRKTAAMGKPLIASMGTVAASGGYYMAMGCDEILAQPTTITGSIGVVAMRFNLKSLYDEFLLNAEFVKTAPTADFLDTYRPLTEAEMTKFRERTYAAYRSFVSKAAESRGMAFEELEAVARGRVWVGTDAEQRGLVDRLGGLDDAIALAAERAGLSNYRLVRYPLEDDSWESLFSGPFASSRRGALEKWRDLVPYELRLLRDALPSEAAPFQLLALAPHWVDVD